jgi:predicted nucleic acid-binding protein
LDSIFLDTGYIIALETSDDQNHESALQHWSSFSKNLPTIVTTSYVFDETVTFFNNRGHHQKSVEIGTNLLKSLYIKFIHVDQILFQEGWRYFKKHNDKTYSVNRLHFICFDETTCNQDSINIRQSFYTGWF